MTQHDYPEFRVISRVAGHDKLVCATLSRSRAQQALAAAHLAVNATQVPAEVFIVTANGRYWH